MQELRFDDWQRHADGADIEAVDATGVEKVISYWAEVRGRCGDYYGMENE